VVTAEVGVRIDHRGFRTWCDTGQSQGTRVFAGGEPRRVEHELWSGADVTNVFSPTTSGGGRRQYEYLNLPGGQSAGTGRNSTTILTQNTGHDAHYYGGVKF